MKKIKITFRSSNPGSESGSAIRKNAGSGSALNQCGSETLTFITKANGFLENLVPWWYKLYFSVADPVPVLVVYGSILINLSLSVRRIRDYYPGSDFFSIPDPNCLHPGSAFKNLSVLTQKNGF
jgi:hypothetical protein